MFFLLVLTFATIAAWEVPGLIRGKLWRELTVFAALWLLGFTLSALLTIGIRPPSPTDGIEFLIKQAAKVLSGGS